MTVSVSDLIHNKIRLPSPPAIAVRILEAVKSPSLTFSDLSGILQSDPALASQILRIVNSPYYAVRGGINSLEHALSYIGMESLKNIALSFVITRELTKYNDAFFDFDLFWKKSLTAAVAADELSKRLKYHSSDMFVTALLQDVGSVVMYLSLPEMYLKSISLQQLQHISSLTAESQIFGFDHTEVSSELLHFWGLPESLYAPIRAHHSPVDLPSKLLMIADTISEVYHSDAGAEYFRGIQDLLLEEFKLTREDSSTLIDNVAITANDIFSSFDLDPGEMKPFSQILQDANDELSKLNVSYELLLMEYKQAKDKAEKLTRELHEANAKLRELAFRDGLTGVYNHRYFQESLASKLSEESLTSLVLVDIDHFKQINDTHGHPIGDEVLKHLGLLLQRHFPTPDVVARYGGEEFAIICPNSTLQETLTRVEKFRVDVESSRVSANFDDLRFTISAGVSSSSSGSSTAKENLIHRADKLLYVSKSSGRNRVSPPGP